ncbi:MAG: LLM class flavin-dependent oxidoreductase, partial [Candidatus Limnocylindrales bacterium]
PVGVRVSRLEEGVAILKGLFGDAPFSFDGDFYTITEMDGQPKPIQRPHPPFMIGGGGKRVLSLAGREADIVSLAPRIARNGRVDPLSLSFEATAEKIDWVRTAAGGRFDDIELNIYPSSSAVIVTDDRRGDLLGAQARIRDRTGVEVDVATLGHAPNIFIGSMDGLTEKFIELRERLGISSVMLGEIEQLAPIVARLKGS